MSEWKEYNITDVCDTISDTYRDGAAKVVLVNTSDVLEGKVTNHEFVPNKNLAGQFKKKFQKNDILYSEIRPANRRYAYVDFEPKDYIASTKLMVLRSKPCILPKYLYYLLTNNTTIHNLHAIAVGRSGTFPQITYSELANIKFRLPSLDEQDEILTTLLYFDDKIAVNRRICENLEAQAQALFKHWFIDFAPFKNGKFVESELGMIPEGWRVGKLGDYCKVKSGFAFKSSMWKEKGCPVIKIKNITNSGRIDMTDCSYISKQNVTKAKAFKANRGDLVIAMTGATIGKFSILPQFDDETYINQRVGKFFLGNNPLEKLPYVFCLLSDNRNRKQLTTMGQGSAQPNISGSDIESIIAVYSNNVIESFNEICYPMFDMILTKQEENLRLSTLRDTLLPKLMSGQIKV